MNMQDDDLEPAGPLKEVLDKWKETQDYLIAAGLYKRKSTPVLENLTSYFDLVFDFENGKFWKAGESKQHTLSFIDLRGKKTTYYAFKRLLENRGEFMEFTSLFKDIESNSISNSKELKEALKKNLGPKLQISDKLPSNWIKYDVEKGVLITAD